MTKITDFRCKKKLTIFQNFVGQQMCCSEFDPVITYFVLFLVLMSVLSCCREEKKYKMSSNVSIQLVTSVPNGAGCRQFRRALVHSPNNCTNCLLLVLVHTKRAKRAAYSKTSKRARFKRSYFGNAALARTACDIILAATTTIVAFVTISSLCPFSEHVNDRFGGQNVFSTLFMLKTTPETTTGVCVYTCRSVGLCIIIMNLVSGQAT